MICSHRYSESELRAECVGVEDLLVLFWDSFMVEQRNSCTAFSFES